MAINKVQYGNQTLIDLTNDTVTANTLLEGITAHDRSGTLITGTLPTMTLPSSTSASATGTERARIFPSTTDTTYLNIPSGYNATNRYYTLRALMIDSKTITQNGTYVAGDDDLDGFSSVTVNVSGGSSEVAVDVALIYNSSQNSTITFSNLLGEPTSFTIICGEETLATGASPYKTAAVVYDGVNDKVQYITNTSNAQMTYEGPGAYHSYNSGQLMVTCSDSQFVQGDYYLIYTYGGGAGNIGTSLVQVGSGATSIQFTGLPDRPIYCSCLFTSNIGTSSGYTRAHVVVGSDDFFGGREMGSASTFSREHWTFSYDNGTLTITSQSTSQGGYFHQPGYYQLTYAVAGDGQITTEPLSVTENGTYTAPFGTAYTPVTVNVASGGADVDTKTVTNSNDQATTLQFTGMKGEPIAFFLRCTGQLSRSSNYSYYYITAIRYNGTNTTGNYWRRSNGTFYNDTTHYSFTYSGTTLTLSSSASRGAAGGSFYSSGYELVYVY